MSTRAAVVAAFASGIAIAVLGFLGASFLGVNVPSMQGSPEDGTSTLRASHGNWEVHRADDGTVLVTVGGQEMLLGIGCTGNVPAVALNLRRGSFANEDVSIRWDDGTPVDYLFRSTGDSTLALPGPDILGRFRRHDTMLIGVERSLDQLVRERFSLRGSDVAVASLPCAQ